MARVLVDADTVTVRLKTWEKMAALKGDVTIPRTDVEEARVGDRPFDELRGLRAPGLGIPRRIALGRWRHRRGTDFVAVRRGAPAFVLDLAPGSRYRRLVIATPDAENLARQLQQSTSAP